MLLSPLCLTAQSGMTLLIEDTPKQEVLSEAHRFLAVYEGTWTEEVSMFAGDGGEPEKSTLTTVINTILGGRFLQCSRTGELHAVPFEGQTTIGYDKNSGLFTVAQISTENTLTLVFEGRWKEPGTSIALQRVQEQKERPGADVQMTITFEDKDNIRIETYGTDSKGTLYKSRVHHFSRQ